MSGDVLSGCIRSAARIVARVSEGEVMAQRVFRQTTSGAEIIQLALRLGVLAFLVYWSFVLVRPFIPILVWSMVLTVALYAPYNWLSVWLGDRPKLAAAIITVINLAIVIGPVTWLGYGVVDGLQDFARQLGAGALVIPSPPEGVKAWPVIGPQIFELWDHASTNLRVALQEVAPHLKPLAGPVLAFAGSAGLGTLKFVASVVLAGFLFHLWSRPGGGNKKDLGASGYPAKSRISSRSRG